VTAVHIIHQSGRGDDADQKEGDERNEQKSGSFAVGLGQSNHLQAENGSGERRVSKNRDSITSAVEQQSGIIAYYSITVIVSGSLLITPTVVFTVLLSGEITT
jgi:hypothetical protein